MKYNLQGLFFKLFNNNNLLLALIIILSSIQLISLGIIGQYISRIYAESKNRPQYIISDTNIE